MKTKVLLLLLINLYCFHLFAQVTLILKPDANEGKDALIEFRSSSVNSNFGDNNDFSAWSWTIGGEITITRSLIEFKIPNLPTGVTIVSAKLSLKCNTTSSIPQLHSGLNESVIRRITGNWNEHSVTWNNQPTTTTEKQVLLSPSVSNIQDYNDIEIIDLVNDARATTPNSIGLQLCLLDEIKYRSLIFASSDHADSSKWPSLKITYVEPNNISEHGLLKSISIYPNPTNDDYLNIQINAQWNSSISFTLFSITGVKYKDGLITNVENIYVGDLLDGVYQLMIQDTNGTKAVFPIVVSNQ